MLTDAEQVPPPFSAGALLHGWTFPPLVVIPVVVIGVAYLVGFRRVHRQPRPVFPRYRAWSFIGGLVAVILAVDGPMDTYSDVDLAMHMAQHLVLLDLVAPLVVLGAPVTVALRASAPGWRSRRLLPFLRSRPVHALSNPWIVVILYAAALFGTHFTPWYDLALYHQYVHDLEHLSYLVVGILLWAVILSVDPVRPPRPGLPQRAMVVILQMPVMTIIAAVFFFWPRPLYPFYPDLPPPWGGLAFAMSSQAVAGAVMAIPSVLIAALAMAYLTRQWFRADHARRRRLAAFAAVADPGRPGHAAAAWYRATGGDDHPGPAGHPVQRLERRKP